VGHFVRHDCDDKEELGKKKGVYLRKVGNTRKNQIDRVPWVLEGLFAPIGGTKIFTPLGFTLRFGILAQSGILYVDVKEYLHMSTERLAAIPVGDMGLDKYLEVIDAICHNHSTLAPESFR
jgi:hypothetical protein